MRFLQWIGWMVVIGIAAVLPWLVHDWILGERSPTRTVTPPPVAESDPRTPGDGTADPGTGTGAETIPENESEAETEATAESPSPPERTAAAKVSDFFRQTWLNVKGSSDERHSDSIHSDRSREAAARVLPALEEELAKKKLSLGQPIFLRIFKESSELELWMEPKPGADYVLFKTWPICEWSGELGPKLKEGDGQSPEGFYFVPPGRMNPESRFHLSFDLGFPNDYDKHHERTGSYLMVHGGCVSVGCYAMTDPAIEEIYTLAGAALDAGQPYFRVHAFPFRMSDEKMDSLKEDGKWFEFWANLKEGYDYFEFLHRPPDVTLSEEGDYEFR